MVCLLVKMLCINSLSYFLYVFIYLRGSDVIAEYKYLTGMIEPLRELKMDGKIDKREIIQ